MITYKDLRISYLGRWNSTDTDGVHADWPCTAIRFGVEAYDERAALDILWSGVRVHINTTIWNATDNSLVQSEVFESPVVLDHRIISHIQFPQSGSYVVTIRKLTCAVSYGMGIGSKILEESKLSFNHNRFVQSVVSSVDNTYRVSFLQ